jgi:hypothetical protein
LLNCVTSNARYKIYNTISHLWSHINPGEFVVSQVTDHISFLYLVALPSNQVVVQSLPSFNRCEYAVQGNEFSLEEHTTRRSNSFAARLFLRFAALDIDFPLDGVGFDVRCLPRFPKASQSASLRVSFHATREPFFTVCESSSHVPGQYTCRYQGPTEK